MTKKTMAIIFSAFLICSLAACTSSQSEGTASTASQISSVSASTTDENSTGNTGTSNNQIAADEMFTERELEQSVDTSDAKKITVSDSSTVDITEEGVYVISGTASNCTVKVDVGTEAKVQLVLDNVSITNTDSPAIYVVSADKCFVTTTGESSLSVTGNFTADGDTNTDAVVFSKDDIVLNGTGTLNISSSQGNGISGKDELKITGGTYNITSALDSLESNDIIAIKDGNITIKTSKNGIHAENKDDDSTGSVSIYGGSITIDAENDGIQAATLLQIDGGNLKLNATEGLEATYICINDGTIEITATDDGINGAEKSSSYGTPTVEINGGTLTITVSGNDVDCIDVNGNLTVSGGTLNLNYPTQGPSSAFDYNGTATYSGGTIIINGTQVDSIPEPAAMGGGNGKH